MSTTLDRIRAKRETGKTMAQIQADQNTDAMFWILTMLAAALFLAVGAWKFFFFQGQISAPVLFWERFLEVCAGGASEAFRLGSLIMAYYESKKGRTITVTFGVLISLSIMAYDVHLAPLVSQPATLETYIFLCLVSEIVAIRAVFGYAFEEGIFSKLNVSGRVSETIETAAETNPSVSGQKLKHQVSDPETTDIDILSNTQRELWNEVGASVSENVSEIDTPVSENDTIQVDGFSGSFTAPEVKSKIALYRGRLENGVGREKTNQDNIRKFARAYKALTGEDICEEKKIAL